MVTPAQAAEHIGNLVIVEGVVTGVGHSQRSDTTFINMGGKYPNHLFTAVIFRSAKALSPDVEKLEGKRAQIRGVVKLYRGKPEIVLERPEQLREQ